MQSIEAAGARRDGGVGIENGDRTRDGFCRIAAYGVMSTPAPVNGRVTNGEGTEKGRGQSLKGISALNDDANKPAPNEGSDKSADKTEEERGGQDRWISPKSPLSASTTPAAARLQRHSDVVRR